ncbi:MAG: MBL fold metallo-hydrolase, partial [Sphingomonas sp.]
MLVRFWGTRGSLPVAMRPPAVADKVARALLAASGRSFDTLADARAFADDLPFPVSGTYGGATACVEIAEAGEAFMVCDLGSGLREFGLDAMRRVAAGHAPVFHIFLSHLHWDHIMGFPFFAPAFVPHARIVIHSGHADAETALRRQMEEISFPVAFDWLAADIRFVTLAPDVVHEVDGVQVELIVQNHSHDSYGYRFTKGRRSLCYSTDSEHKLEDRDAWDRFVTFFRYADLVVFDTMYSLADSVTMKADWGHSSN